MQEAIARTASEVREHERQRAAAARELRCLEVELRALDAPVRDVSCGQRVAEGQVPSTAAETVAVFRARFRGRDDVCPVLWTHRRTRRTGCAPACGIRPDAPRVGPGGMKRRPRTADKGSGELETAPGRIRIL